MCQYFFCCFLFFLYCFGCTGSKEKVKTAFIPSVAWDVLSWRCARGLCVWVILCAVDTPIGSVTDTNYRPPPTPGRHDEKEEARKWRKINGIPARRHKLGHKRSSTQREANSAALKMKLRMRVLDCHVRLLIPKSTAGGSQINGRDALRLSWTI